MKKFITFIFLISVILIAECCPANGQTTNTVSIDTSGMPANVKAVIAQKMQQDAVTTKLETYGKWAGMGKEIGIAAREGLTAVKDVAVDIADSKLGGTIMFLIIWKVAGIDFVRIFVGLIVMIISIWLISRSYFSMFSTRRLVEKTGWWIFGNKKYEPRELPEPVLDGVPNSWAAGLHWFFLCIMIGIAAIIAFA